MDQETTKSVIRIALEVIKVILQGIETFSSGNKQERKDESNAESKAKSDKP